MLKRKASDRFDKKAVLVLADGTIVTGTGFGAVKKVSGEVVFNTGMTGYPEAITDPSYNGQILMQTYPIMGNYGVYPEHFESDGPKIEGYIIRDLCREPSHWSSKMTLDKWLEDSGIPGIERVDTRMLTKKIRTYGAMLGILRVYENGNAPDFSKLLKEAKQIPDPNKTDLVSEVATKTVQKFDAKGFHHVVIIDSGVKKAIIKSLLDRKVNVTLVPPSTSADKILDMKPNGILLPSGPGDPKMASYLVNTVKELIQTEIPIMGICFGSQIITLAFGGDTYKLKFGHRGQNHPAIELKTGRCYITSQNHGYAVKEESLKGTGLKVTYINANDRTVEGVAHTKKPIFAIQFHPEASPGPQDTEYLFDLFLKNLEKMRGDHVCNQKSWEVSECPR